VRLKNLFHTSYFHPIPCHLTKILTSTLPFFFSTQFSKWYEHHFHCTIRPYSYLFLSFFSSKLLTKCFHQNIWEE
jgi:hypothetical protein